MSFECNAGIDCSVCPGCDVALVEEIENPEVDFPHNEDINEHLMDMRMSFHE